MNLINKIKKDISILKPDVYAIILYGSYANNTSNIRSDVDICIVLKTDNQEKIKDVYRQVLQISGKNEKYDLKIFELLPLKIKFDVITNGKILYAKDIYKLGEYFYFYRKLWQDQSINWVEKHLI